MPHVSNQTGSRFVWEKHRQNPNNPSEYQTFPKDKDMNDPNAESLWVSANKKDSDILKATTQPGTTGGGTSATGEGDITGIKLPGPPGEEEVGRWFTGFGELGEMIGDVDVSGQPAYLRAWTDAAASVGLEHIHDIEIISGTGSRAGYITWQLRGQGIPADQTWTVFEADDGSIFMYDKNVGPSSRVPLVTASTVKPTAPGVQEAGSITNADDSVTTFYSVTDASGRTSMQKVTTSAASAAPTEKDIITFDEADGGGRLIPLGGGKYTYEPPEDEPFTTSSSDVVPLPNQNGSLIKTSANQYQFVRDTFDPGRKVDATGREYLQQRDGIWYELDPRFEPELIRADGMNLFQQRSGDVTQLSAATMDDVITQALIDGDVDKALAFQDFRDRPTAQEAFNTALEFARSPADQVLISSIARGEQTVQPPPAGTIQRVGPQADFLIQAYEDFQRRTQAGRAPTGEEISAATEDPTLQARLESIANKDRREEEKHQLFVASETAKQQRAQEAFEAQEATRAAESAAKVAAATAASTSGDTGGDVATSTTGDAGEETPTEIQTAPPGTRVKQEGTTTMVNDKGEVANIADALVDQFQSGENPAGWRVISEKELQDADTAAAEAQATAAAEAAATAQAAEAERQAAGIKKAEEFRAALDAGFDPADYHNIGGRAIEAHQASLAAEAEQQQEDIRTEARAAIDADLDIVGRGLEPSAGMPEKPWGEDLQGIPRSGAPTFVNKIEQGWSDPPTTLAGYAPGTTFADIEKSLGLKPRAGGGTVQPGEITVVGEQGPEIAMMPPGTHILPLGKATKRDIKAAQATGRAYQQGGIVFGELPFGIRQLQAGRPITPSRGYLSQAAGLTLPSAQALTNLTPESRDVYFDLARQAGIPSRAFGQELQTAMPSGTRLPTSRMLPLGRRGVR